MISEKNTNMNSEDLKYNVNSSKIIQVNSSMDFLLCLSSKEVWKSWVWKNVMTNFHFGVKFSFRNFPFPLLNERSHKDFLMETAKSEYERY